MNRKKLFGTDGIRGHIDSTNLQPQSIQRLGYAIGKIVNYGLAQKGMGESRASVLIGRDTRASGPVLEDALISGLQRQHIECKRLGVLPTSFVAHHTRKTSSDLGIMISASHNPFYDNGLKFFDARGLKISLALEQEIERQYYETTDPPQLDDCFAPKESIAHKDPVASYCRVLKQSFETNNCIDRMRVVIDCANGAASNIAKEIFDDLGIDAYLIGASPDGYNINLNFGSEHPQTLRNQVIKHEAKVGIAFDGDADRVIFVDELGKVIDGDAILALMARDLKQKRQLVHDTMVATVMSSVALDKALAGNNINVVRTEVGDKFVVRKMVDHGYSFGGENSGHLIKFPEATTGDGIFSAMQFLDILRRAKRPASELVKFYEPTPKLLKNIDIEEKIPFEQLPKTTALINHANKHLNSAGRVMIRYSGTENKARLLVEAPSNEECHRIANSIFAEFISELLASGPMRFVVPR